MASADSKVSCKQGMARVWGLLMAPLAELANKRLLYLHFILFTALALFQPVQIMAQQRLPILFILADIDPAGGVDPGDAPDDAIPPGNDADYDFDPALINHAFWRGLLNGDPNRIVPNPVATIDLFDGIGADPGRYPGNSPFPMATNRPYAMSAMTRLFVSPSQSGNWTFRIRSRGGVRLIIDDEVVIEDPSINIVSDTDAKVDLATGEHSVELLVFANLGGFVELSAARNSGASPQFYLLGDAPAVRVDPLRLNIDGNGFTLRHRYTTLGNLSLETADKLMRQPFHNLVDYFAENSYGNLQLVPAAQGEIDQFPGGIPNGLADGIVGPVQFMNTTTDVQDKRSVAIQLADPLFNFARYDRDGDGLERHELAVVVIFAQPKIPGHSTGNVRFPKNSFMVDGITVPTSFPVAGIHQYAGWRILVEELSHVISPNAWDLYNLNNGGANLSRYDVMGSTSLYHSMHHNPWSKEKFGWLTAQVVQPPGHYTLQPVEMAPEVLRIDHPSRAGEYLLIENRTSPGTYDDASPRIDDLPFASTWRFRPNRGIPDDGLVIYHVDENRISSYRKDDFTSPTFIRRISPHWSQAWMGAFSGGAWNDKTPMNIAIPCVTQKGLKLSFDIKASDQGFRSIDTFDAAELNDDPELATMLKLGSKYSLLSLHADCDIDHYRFELAELSDVTIATWAFEQFNYEGSVPGPNLKLTKDGKFIKQGSETLSLFAAAPGEYVLKVDADSSFYYDLQINASASTLAPDRFDDEVPPGERRNDTRADATQLSMDMGAVPPQVVLNLPWVTRRGGLEIVQNETDLNFDQDTDVDHFHLSIGLKGFPYSDPIGGECPEGAGAPLSLANGYSSKGALRIQVFPETAEKLDIKVFDASGIRVDTRAFAENKQGPWGSQVVITCPTENLASWPDASGRGKLVVSVKNPTRRLNRYVLSISYSESEAFEVDRDQFPHPVWDLLPELVAWPEPLPRFASVLSGLAQCPELTCPEKSSAIIVPWTESGDLKLRLQSTDRVGIVAQLYGPTGPVSEAVRGVGELSMSFQGLDAGTYLLKVETRSGPATLSVSFGDGH